jgi:tetraacyldisaccharide 4'-kinase
MSCPRFLEEIYLYLHRRRYAKRREKAVHFETRVVSIGNLSMGGTGKTPLVEYLVRKKRAKRPMVVLRGYGSSGSGLVSDGSRILSTFEKSGDEAMLLAQLPGLRVAAGPDRAELIREFGQACDLILLDDAFQNPTVARDVELVLIDATIPPERLRVAPCGKFRERLDALERAHAVLLTRAEGQAGDLWEAVIRKTFPALPVYRSEHVYTGLAPLVERGSGAASAPPQKAGAFCGIGNPGAFLAMLKRQGVEITTMRKFRDHFRYRASDIRSLLRTGSWVTTAKDAVRILPLGLSPEELASIWIARMELRITLGEESLCRLVFGDEGE